MSYSPVWQPGDSEESDLTVAEQIALYEESKQGVETHGGTWTEDDERNFWGPSGHPLKG